ncbi:ribosomal protein L7/L12 [Escherichia coli]
MRKLLALQLAVIKAVRGATGWCLKKLKDRVICTGCSERRREQRRKALKKALEEAGAEVKSK